MRGTTQEFAHAGPDRWTHTAASSSQAVQPGKLTLSQALPVQASGPGSAGPAVAPVAAALAPPGPHRSLQMLFGPPAVKPGAQGAGEGSDVHAIAARGVAGSGSALPHLDRIQASFGARHDVSHVQAHVGGSAAEAATAIGAQAYATGHHVAFAGAPSLHTAAHEAAHVVQQRAGVHLRGAVGETGDAYERHADEVADRVVAGEPTDDLLNRFAGSGGTPAVQRVDTAGPKEDNSHIVYGTKGDTDSLKPNGVVNAAIDQVLDELRKRDEGKWDPKKKKHYGYMVGVAQCVDGTLVAAMSGSTRDPFREAVQLRLRHASIAGSMPSKQGRRSFGTFSSSNQPISQSVSDDEKSFGDCAGPRILHWAQVQGPKKTPIALVEKFFSPEKSGVDEYVNGTTVAPCAEHCEKLVPWMLTGRAEAAKLGREKIEREQQQEQLENQLWKQKLIARELEKQLAGKRDEIWKALFALGRDDDLKELLSRFNQMTESEQTGLKIERWVADTLNEIDKPSQTRSQSSQSKNKSRPTPSKIVEQEPESQRDTGKKKPQPTRTTQVGKQLVPKRDVTESMPEIVKIATILVTVLVAALLIIYALTR